MHVVRPTGTGSALPGGSIALLGLLTIVAYGTWFYGFGVLIDDIAADLAGGLVPLTVGYALAQVSTGVFGVAAGRALDRAGARVPFAVGALVGPPALVTATVVDHPWWFALWFGIGGGAIGAVSFYHLTQTVAARLAVGAEVRAIARLTIWGAFASPVLIPLTEVARSLVGWRSTIRVGAVAVAVVLVWCALRVDRARATASRTPSPSPWSAVRRALAVPHLRRMALSSLAGAFGASVLVVLQVPAMAAAGLDRGTAAGFAGARGVAQLLGRIPLTAVLARVPSRWALRGARLLVALGTLLLAVSGSVALAVVFVLVAGTGLGALSPLEGIYAREVLPAEDLGTLMGALYLLLGAAAGAGPLVAAAVIDLTGSIGAGLSVAAAASVVSAIVLTGAPAAQRAEV